MCELSLPDALCKVYWHIYVETVGAAKIVFFQEMQY